MYDETLHKKVKQATMDFKEIADRFDTQEPLRKSTGYFESEKQPVYSEQTQEFQKILDDMFELHLKKTSDYSAWNIKGAGEQGVAVRLWDKVARLMNLQGWDIGTGKWTQPKEPKNESIDDTLMDLASYAIIMMILRRGKWGK